MVDPPPPSPSRRAVGLSTGTDPPPGLLAQLGAEYPEVSAGAVADAVNLAVVAASKAPDRPASSRGRIAALARDRLAVLRIRSAAAARRAVRSPDRIEGEAGEGPDVQPWARAEEQPGRSGTSRDMDALSRFDRLYDVVLAHAGQAALTADSLCRAAAAHLKVAAVAVSVPDGLVPAQTVGAAGELARRLEDLQVLLGEGPTIDGLTGGRAVPIDDLNAPVRQARWPIFAPQAVWAGAVSMYVLPMHVGAARFGVLVVYLDRPGGLPPSALAEARGFAAIALQLLLDRAAAPRLPAGGALDGESDPTATGRRFFDDRPEIHQATGMVSAQLDVDLATALLLIRARAFAQGRLLTELAADVVARNVRFHPDEQ